MMKASGFIEASSAVEMRLAVSLVLGTCTVTASATLRISATDMALDAVQLGGLGGDVGVVADDVHAQGASAVGHGHADLAQADDAQRLVDQLAAHEGGAVPLAGVHRGVGRGDVARQREEQRQGVLGGGGGVAGGRVDDGDAGRGGGGDVDVVDTDAGAADDHQPRAGGDGLGVGLDAAAHEQGVVLGQGREELVARHAHAHIDVVLFLEEGDALRRQLLSDEDAHRSGLLAGATGGGGTGARARWATADARRHLLDDLDGR